MKKNFKFLSLAVIALFALMATSCEKINNSDNNNGNENGNGDDTTTVDSTIVDTTLSSNLHTLSFEDVDGDTYWYALTSPALHLDTTFNYSWKDSVLVGSSSVDVSYYDSFATPYWNGGVAISNLVDTVLANGVYTNDLAIYNAMGGNKGSKNFAVCYCNNFNPEVSSISFVKGKKGIIKTLYVASTTYCANAAINGNSYSSPLTNSDSITVSAVGYFENKETGKVTFNTFSNGKMVTEWTPWDLSSLGVVDKVVFSLDSTDKNEWGNNQPSYFAFDDVSVEVK